jgi:hypothetical protein
MYEPEKSFRMDWKIGGGGKSGGVDDDYDYDIERVVGVPRL